MMQGLDMIRRRFFARWKRIARAMLYSVAALGAVFWIAIRVAPFPDAKMAQFPASSVLTDRAGDPLRVWLGVDDLDCRPVYRPDPNHWIVQALIAAEDQRFWSHPGVDLLALLRAMKQNGLAGRTLSGASTLSTQVIRLIEPRPRTLWTKAVEAFRAFQMEHRYAKEEILAQYLNRAPFGGNIVGIEAASWRYFSKRPADLSLAEAALLAGVPQSPSRCRPDRHPERAAKRQLYVLERMKECGYITASQSETASSQTITVRPARYPFRAPHFASWVGASTSFAQHSTLDPDLQRRAEHTLRRHMKDSAVQGGAIVILDVKSGAVRAMVGSPNFDAQPAGQVNGALAPRAAGSTLKPFAYALAMDRGWMTPLTVLTDVPARFRDYDPHNFDATFRGWVTLRDALVLSLNLPAIEVVRRVGPPLYYNTLRDLGLTRLWKPAEHYGLGLVLGNAEVRLLDLANAYACLARGGLYQPVRVMEGVTPSPQHRVFSEEACWLLAEMLSGDERAMDTTGHAADVHLPRMAWKTGTSAGLRDAWTVAYNPEFVIGVWVGRPDGGSSDLLVGRSIATPIVWDIFRGMYPDNQSPWYDRPLGLVARSVCAVSGCVPGPHCGQVIDDWAITQVSRNEPCPAHRIGRPAVASHVQPKTKPVARPASVVRIATPARGSTFRWMDDLKEGTQQIPLNAVGERNGERLHWFVNDQPVGISHSGESLFWPMERGSHQIVCSTDQGMSDRIQITVK